MKWISTGFLTLFIVFGVFHPDAGAAEWTPFVDDQRFKHSYDKQSLFHSPQGLVRVAIKVDPKGKEGRDFLLAVREKMKMNLAGYENYGFSLIVMEIDCANHQKRTLQSDDYTSKGEQLDSVSPQNPKWAQIAPDSVHGLYEKALCKK